MDDRPWQPPVAKTGLQATARLKMCSSLRLLLLYLEPEPETSRHSVACHVDAHYDIPSAILGQDEYNRKAAHALGPNAAYIHSISATTEHCFLRNYLDRPRLIFGLEFEICHIGVPAPVIAE